MHQLERDANDQYSSVPVADGVEQRTFVVSYTTVWTESEQKV